MHKSRSGIIQAGQLLEHTTSGRIHPHVFKSLKKFGPYNYSRVDPQVLGV